jgi:hypothetical protein
LRESDDDLRRSDGEGEPMEDSKTRKKEKKAKRKKIKSNEYRDSE